MKRNNEYLSRAMEKMRKRFVVRKVWPRLLAAALLFALRASAQTGPSQSESSKQTNAGAPPRAIDVDGWGRPASAPIKGQKPALAPRHDLSGTWAPANGALDGGGFAGAKNMPEDGKPEHRLPFTPLGLETYNRTKPTIGPRMVLTAETNDPEAKCDPQGMPREDLFQLRETQIVQTPESVFILYQYDRIWRVIWADGRRLPQDPEPRWFGYSVGKWLDDYTFVAETSGTDERTWLDLVGRPHSAELRMEERFHRVDHDNLELTVTIDDPKMYTKPWVALDKFPMKLLPASFDVREMICSPSEAAAYNKLIADPSSEKGHP